jgi:isoamylase
MTDADRHSIALGSQHPETGPFSPLAPASWAAASFPLGAHRGVRSTTFAVYAAHAERVLLEVYGAAQGEDARYDYLMGRGPDGIFRAELADVPIGALYGFRCWGPNFVWDEAWRRGGSSAGFRADVDVHGHRYNPNKLLIDPYARELSHDPVTPALHTAGLDATMYLSGPGVFAPSGAAPRPRREVDTGPMAPKAVVVHDTTPTGTRPRIAAADAILYEAHVRGLTRHPSSARLADLLAGIPGFEAVRSIPPELRGTYRAAGMMAPYLRALGYTTIELLPVHEFANGLNLEEPAADAPPIRENFWGYMTYGFFAPDRRYAADRSLGGPTREFKEMIRAFHDAGLEVYLDVVYNHTGEGGLASLPDRPDQPDVDTAELLVFRGLDNTAYYALVQEDPREYWVSTGCGNNLDCSQPVVRKLILDSLEYWCGARGGDGFRFDHATVRGRSATIDYRFTGGAELLQAIAALAAREDLEVIAEAWDCEYPAGYQVGNFPPGWAEWNGNFRDVLRRFGKGDPGLAFAFADVVNGDYSRFADQGGPHKSVNFLTAHDGFTLMDLVSYGRKLNDAAWPFGPSDGGADENHSWDSAGDPALRRERLRSLVTLQLFARGVPMTVYGDELCRTQNGNNNPWSLDSVATWNNYDMIATSTPHRVPTGGPGEYHDNYGQDGGTTGKNGFFLFLHHLLALRGRYRCLRQAAFADLQRGSPGDVSFLFTRPDGSSPLDANDRAIAWWIEGSAVGEDDFLLLVNMRHEPCGFSIPAPRDDRRWQRIIDTARWAEGEGNTWSLTGAEVAPGSTYGVHAYCVTVLAGVTRPTASVRPPQKQRLASSQTP